MSRLQQLHINRPLDESMKSLHSSQSLLTIRALNKSSISLQYTRSSSIKKNGTRSFWRSPKKDTLTSSSKRFNSCSLEPNNSALHLGRRLMAQGL